MRCTRQPVVRGSDGDDLGKVGIHQSRAQAQGDLFVGAETLPITLGEERTLLLLKGVALFLGLFLIAAPLSGAVGSFSYLLLFTVLSSTLYLFAYERRWFHPGRRFEALVEGNFFLAGLLGLIWQLFY